MRAIYVLVIFILLSSLVSAENIEPEEYKYKFDDVNYTAYISKIDMKHYNMEIVSVADYFASLEGADDRGKGRIENINGKDVITYNKFSLQDYWSTKKGKKPSLVASLGYLLLNGEPAPRGLLKIEGNELSRITDSKETSKYLTGILCLKNKKVKESHVSKPAMYKKEDYIKKNECISSVQVGPRIIENIRKRGINSKGKDDENRTVFFMGSDYHIYISYWEETPLYVVQELLMKGVMGEKSIPRFAINITMRELSGMIFNDGSAKGKSIGHIESIIPAMLVFTKRENIKTE